jgi:uncharacterized LabA/DUF88 family protein
MGRGMIMVDGSFLFASINRIRRADKDLEKLKLNIGSLSYLLRSNWGLLLGEIVRTSYYFKKNDKRIDTLLTIPDIQVSNIKDHWQIIECAQPIETVPDEEIEKLDPKFRDAFSRAEKGLDMRLACDSLSTAATGRITDFAFMINDRDYIPMLEALQRFGCCTYLTTLYSEPPNKMLLDICDRYISLDQQAVKNLFNI